MGADTKINIHFGTEVVDLWEFVRLYYKNGWERVLIRWWDSYEQLSLRLGWRMKRFIFTKYKKSNNNWKKKNVSFNVHESHKCKKAMGWMHKKWHVFDFQFIVFFCEIIFEY